MPLSPTKDSVNRVVRHVLPKDLAIQFAAAVDNFPKRVIDDAARTITLIHVNVNASLLWPIGCPKNGRCGRPEIEVASCVVVEINRTIRDYILVGPVKLVMKRLERRRYDFLSANYAVIPTVAAEMFRVRMPRKASKIEMGITALLA